jgi:hypothetical protein
MTDLSAATWREIELNASMHDGRKQISLPILRNILRRSRRTPDQNALLWALYDDALKAGGEALGGWTKDDIHEYMLGEYWGWDEQKAFGRTRLKPKKRSSQRTKLEFADFVEFVVRRFAEHGIVLQLPGEVADGRRYG